MKTDLLKRILQYIGLAFTLMVTFLGMLYILNGDLFFSSMTSIALVVLLYFIVEHLIDKKTQIKKTRFSSTHFTLWGFYIALAIPITFLLVHTLTVEILAKKDIQSLANTKMTALKEMKHSYKDQYEKYIETEIATDLETNLLKIANNPRDYSARTLLNSEPYNLSDTTIDGINRSNYKLHYNTIISAKTYLFESALDSITIKDSLFTINYKSTFFHWSRLRLNTAFSELDKLLQDSYSFLSKKFSQYSHIDGAKFDFALQTEEPLINKPLALWSKYNPFWMILMTLIFHLLILLPYFMTEVSGEYLKKTKRISTDIKNEPIQKTRMQEPRNGNPKGGFKL